MKHITDSEFNALISLLDDPDEDVIMHVSGRLKELGIKGVEKLENAWQFASDELQQSRIENLISEIQFERLKEELIQWKANDSKDLLLGAILVAKFRYPELDESVIYSSIDKIVHDIWIELNDGLTPLEEIHVFNNVFYKLTGFLGEQDGFTQPDLGFINKVLQLKKGSSQAIGILYLILCKELKIPVLGINLPFHFVMAYVKSDVEFISIKNITKSDISFYINPVNEGLIFHSKQIGEYLKQMNVEPSKEHYLPCDNITIIASLIYHIKMCYENIGNQDNASKLNDLYNVLVDKVDKF